MKLGRRNQIAALATAIAGLLAVLVSALAVGAEGPGSAVLGALLVLAFFSAGSLPFIVAGDGTGGRSGLAFLVLGMTYVLRILLGVAVYAVATQSEAVNTKVVGFTVIGCALVWTNSLVVLGVMRRHQPTLDL